MHLVSGMLRICRAGHFARICSLVAQLLELLCAAAAGEDRGGGGGERGVGEGGEEAAVMALKLKAKAVAQGLYARRAYVGKGGQYDPRLLVFEFSSNLVLRHSQVLCGAGCGVGCW
jgi:hypothetical protein